RYNEEYYISARDIRDLREMVRYRTSLVRMRVEAKNKLHAILLQNGTRLKEKPFTICFVEELRRLGDYRIDGYLNIVSSLSQQIQTVSNTIKREAREDELTRLLMTIPGVGYFSAVDTERAGRR